ncbi:MAG TPA: hypothetical protein DCO79_11470 [Spirochaeta sp.]|nr:hypothetical protein [Spirochaeta sp.]
MLLAGISAGGFAGLSLNRGTPSWSGLPAARVVRLHGRAAADSRKLSSGSYMLELDLKVVEAGNGAIADAGGRTLLFFDKNPAVFAGRLISVDAALKISDTHNALMQRQRLSEASLLKDSAVFTANPRSGSLSRGGWSSPLAEYRAQLAGMIAARCNEMGPAAGGLFAALFSGNRDGLSVEESSIFRRAGCSHILALSGMHLGILSGIILLLLKPLPGRKVSFAVSCVIIFAYLFLTGFGISLVRAAVMYFCCGAAMVFYREFRGIDVLLLSFIVLVLIEPSSFYTAAFRLSFLAVGGIILAAPTVNRILRPYMPSFLRLPLSASIGAQLFVIPLLAQLFGEIYPAGLAAGIILAPLVTVFIWAGIIYLFSGLGAAAIAADLLYRLIFLIAGKASVLPSLSVEDDVAAVSIICGLIALALILFSLYRRRFNGISGKL